MKDFPQLFTDRLHLRKIHIYDIPLLVKYANNKQVSDHILNIPYPYQEPDAVFRIRYVNEGFKTNSRYVFAIVLKETNEFIGEISLHLDDKKDVAQLAYWIGEPFWKNGFATEAVKAILKFGFETLNVDLIFATCDEKNLASTRVLEKNEMRKKRSTGSILEYTSNQQEYLLKQ